VNTLPVGNIFQKRAVAGAFCGRMPRKRLGFLSAGMGILMLNKHPFGRLPERKKNPAPVSRNGKYFVLNAVGIYFVFSFSCFV
jgi:hypothetical protein